MSKEMLESGISDGDAEDMCMRIREETLQMIFE